MPNQWFEGPSIGVLDIDNQHRELLARVQSLVDAVAQGGGAAAIDGRIRSLEAYAVAHFGSEEELMIVFGWPEYASHRREHSAFLERFVDLRYTLLGGSAASDPATEARREMHDWLIQHIRETDMALGRFLRPRMPNRRLAAS
jgi:hemerythrin